MGSFASAVLLESSLVPFLATFFLAVIGALGGARQSQRPSLWAILASVSMLPVSVGLTYGLALGWPQSFGLDARSKLLIAVFLGALTGLGLSREIRWSWPALILLVIALPLWIGLPALSQAKPGSGFLIAPALAGLAVVIMIRKNGHLLVTPRWMIILITLALGIAGIAALGRALTFAELALALGSSLTAAFLAVRSSLNIPLMPAAIGAVTMLLALATVLLLYSEASKLALLALATTFFATIIADLARRHAAQTPTSMIFALACLLPLSAALLIARVDAGSISIY